MGAVFQIATPVMTGYTTPSGTVTESGNQGAGSEGWRAFTQTDANFWADGTGVSAPSWLTDKYVAYEFTSAKTITRYGVRAGSPWPIDFKLQGWNGISYDDLDSRSGESFGASEQTYDISSPSSYSKYRFLVTLGGNVTFPDDILVYFVNLYETVYENQVPALDLGFQLNAAKSVIGKYNSPPPLDLNFVLVAPSYALKPPDVTVPSLDLPIVFTAPATKIEPNEEIPSVIIYRARLTGAPDGLDDLSLDFRSFNARLRNDLTTYLSLVLPYQLNLDSEIALRPNGELVIQRGVRYFDGSEQLVEIVRTSFDDTQDNAGGRNRSITLSGTTPVDYGTPKTIILQGVVSRTSSSSGIRLRSGLDLNLRPGDTAEYGSDSFIVGLITYVVNVRSGSATEVMDVSESQ